MSEQNITNGLSLEDLEKTDGGFTIEYCSFDAGDCFEDDARIFKVLNDAREVHRTANIHCLLYIKPIDRTEEISIPAMVLTDDCKFIGNNVF